MMDNTNNIYNINSYSSTNTATTSTAAPPPPGTTTTTTTTKSPFEIKTIIIDLSKEKDSADYSVHYKKQDQVIKTIEKLISSLGASPASSITLSSSTEASETSAASSSSSAAAAASPLYEYSYQLKKDKEAKKALTQSILRFIQPRDKITQLTSNLLKSVLYHYYYRYYTCKDPNVLNLFNVHLNMNGNGDNSHGNANSDKLKSNNHIVQNPIVVLERTPERRPYIHLELCFNRQNDDGQNDGNSHKSMHVNGTFNDNGGNDNGNEVKEQPFYNEPNEDHIRKQAIIHRNNSNNENDDDNDNDDHGISSSCCCNKNKKNYKKTSKTYNSSRNHKNNVPLSSSSLPFTLSLPFSISHQYPIAALSFIIIETSTLRSSFDHKDIDNDKSSVDGSTAYKNNRTNTVKHEEQGYEKQQQEQHNQQHQTKKSRPKRVLPLLGMDVVIFNQIQNFTINEYLFMYKNSFTLWEWEQIQMERQRKKKKKASLKLIEFYLRWSMKEAYTKALGLGMGIDFKSFESHLIGFDVDHIDTYNNRASTCTSASHRSCSLWDCILHQCQKRDMNGTNGANATTPGIAYFPAYIYQINRDNEKTEMDDSWCFYFMPQLQNDSHGSFDNDDLDANAVLFNYTGRHDSNSGNDDGIDDNNYANANHFIGCSCICVQSKNEGNIMRSNDNVNANVNSNDKALGMESMITKLNMSIKDLCDFHSI